MAAGHDRPPAGAFTLTMPFEQRPYPYGTGTEAASVGRFRIKSATDSNLQCRPWSRKSSSTS